MVPSLVESAVSVRSQADLFDCAPVEGAQGKQRTHEGVALSQESLYPLHGGPGEKAPGRSCSTRDIRPVGPWSRALDTKPLEGIWALIIDGIQLGGPATRQAATSRQLSCTHDRIPILGGEHWLTVRCSTL